MPAGELIRRKAAAPSNPSSGQTIVYQKLDPLETVQDGDIVSNTPFRSKPVSIIGLLVNRVKLEKICHEQATFHYPPADLGTGFDNGAGSICIDGDKIVLAGYFTTYKGEPAPYMVRLYDNGNIETTFGSLLSSNVGTYIIDSDGKYLLGGGNFTHYNGVRVERLVRVNKDRSIDYAFDIGFGQTFMGVNGEVMGMIEDSNGQYVLAGNFTNYKGVNGMNRIMRLNKDGSRDTSFVVGTGLPEYNQGRIIEDKGISKYVVAGNFTTYNGAAANRIVRINMDGSRDTSFVMGTGFNKNVYCIVQQGDKYYCGGSFTSYNGVSKNYIVRLNRDGSIDSTFNIGTGFTSTIAMWPSVSTILPLEDGRILVGGNFNRYNGQPTPGGLIMLNNDGSVDSGFSTTVQDDKAVTSIVRHDGKFLVAGAFTTINGEVRNRFAILDENGALDTGKTKTEFKPDPAILQKNGQPITLQEWDETARIAWHPSKSGYQIETSDEIELVYVEQ